MGAMTGLLLLLWAGVTVGSVLDLQKRIIGGVDCPNKERQYHVILIGDNGPGDRGLCGGSLINNQWILTAAHCWEYGPGWNMKAYVGRPPAGREVEITEQKNYTDSAGKKHDIMLLKLRHAITDIPPVGLPKCDSSPIKTGDEVQTAGHASTNVGPNNVKVKGSSLILQCAETTIVDCKELSDCVMKNNPQDWEFYKYQHWFCGKRDNVDVAFGDSGGGVVFKEKLYGVNVFVGDPIHACNKAVGFMDICHKEYADWIHKTTSTSSNRQGWEG